MRFDLNLVKGKIIKRYKRFLADVILEDGQEITAHCPNPGSMLTCYEEGAPVMLTHNNDPKRKTQYTLEMIKIGTTWIGVNTSIPNKIVYDLIENNHIDFFSGSTNLKREVKYADSRFDMTLELENQAWFVEIKSVSMAEKDIAMFPDSPTERGRKHLKRLTEIAKSNKANAALIYFIQRNDISSFKPAEKIDPEYAKLLDNAIQAGVQILAIQMQITPEALAFEKLVKVYV